jgi:hypothetical protein
MNRSSRFRRRLSLLACALLAWTTVTAGTWAWAAEGESSGGGGGAQRYLASYAIVFLCIGLGVFTVVTTGRRREREKGAKLEGVAAGPDLLKKEAGVPVVSLGMLIAQVNKALGKPKISRRGDDIYRELAQAGKLSEEDAAKVYSIYEHPAGRYELVSLDGRVIEIKTQPVAKKPA